MATVTVVIQKDTVRTDKRGRTFANGQDADTNQFVTFYPRKDSNGQYDGLEEGQTVVFYGTIHNIGDNPKVITTNVEVVS
jgi:hypothetical protein